MHLVTLEYIAEDLNISLRTVQNYCKQGFLPAFKTFVNNKAKYQVDIEKYQKWKAANSRDLSERNFTPKIRIMRGVSLSKSLELIPEWLHWCKTGQLTGKPLANRTLEIYDYYFRLYLRKIKNHDDNAIFGIDNLRETLGSFPIESYSTKKNIFDSVRSFARFLVAKGLLMDEARDKLRSIKPKRFYPPKRTVLTKEEYQELLTYIEKAPRKAYDRLFTKTLVMFIVNTGLRAMEVANLKPEDVDLENGIVYVWLGKGNKNRKVGLTREILEQLKIYESHRYSLFKDNQEKYFINYYGTPLDRDVLIRKLKRLSVSSGIEFTAHGLRITFATLWSQTDKPLNHLRIALGHADLSTTQSYIMTTEDEVVEAMRGW